MVDSKGRYKIDADVDNKLLTDKLIGYWDVATAERFFDDYTAAIRKMAAGGPGWKILANHEEFGIQPPEVTAVIARLSTYVMASSAAKVAIYMPGALSRLQAKRMTADEKCQTFASEEEARAWLDE